MIEQLRKRYYWGDVDKKLYKFDYFDFATAVDKLWEIDSIDDIDCILSDAFADCKELYLLSKHIIFDYVHERPDTQKYKNDLRNLNSNKTKWYHWDLLRRVFGGVNACYYSGMCRNLAIEKLENVDEELALRKYSIRVCQGDYESAESLMQMLDDSSMNENWKDRYDRLADYNRTVIKRTKIDDDYGEYLADKKVVIVGVAPHTSHSEDENEDAVNVFMNYSGKGQIDQTDRCKHINISYYSAFNMNKVVDEQADYLNDLDYMVCKSSVPNINVFDKYDTKVRMAHPLMFGCPFGHPLMVPIIIFDLLHYRTGNIHVTNTNLYSSQTTYYPGYTEYEVKGLIRDLPSHDLVGNWRLMKTWYEQGLFTCDSELRSVLEMTQEEYLIKVENSFNLALSKSGKV